MGDVGKFKWLDQYLISHQDHQHALEQRAAELEFSEKVPRHQAEARAYSEYRKEQHYRGAAHHLRGLRAAQASGDREDARKHDAMLNLHAKAAGFDPYQETPAELNQYMHSQEPESVHRFKAHRSDLLVLDDHKKDVEKAEIQAEAFQVLKKAELVLLLKSQGPASRQYSHWPDGTPKKKVKDKCGTCGAPHKTEDHDRARHFSPETWEKWGSVGKSEELSKADGKVLQFPKGRTTPAVDQGKAASVGKISPKVHGGPLYKPGHKVAASGRPGVIHKVYPGKAPGDNHLYHVKFQDGGNGSVYEHELTNTDRR